MSDLGIAVFTYRRPEHTKRVLESLRANHPKKLYIFQDGLRDEKDREDWQQVSDLIRRVDFAETEVHISNKNQGCAKSIISGLDYVFSKHDMAVSIEDDIVVSSQYLRFMRTCLEKYAGNQAVASIAGVGWPFEVPKDYGFDVFFSYRFSCNAWGTWKDRWRLFHPDYKLMGQIIHDPEKKAILEKSGNDIYAIMQAQVMGRCDSWALFWTLMQIDNHQVSVLPTRYVAKDIGFDGVNATHNTVYTTRFDTVLYDGSVENWKLPDQIIINDDIIDQIRIVLNNPLAEDRLNSHFSITKKWIECLQKGGSFADFFAQKGIRAAYIYGASDVGRLLFEQIKDLVEVKGFLEHDKSKGTVCGCQVYDFADDIQLQNEAIIVTPVHDWDFIVYSVTKRFGMQKFIHLEKMLDGILRRTDSGLIR